MVCPKSPWRNTPVQTFSFIQESKTAFWNIYFEIPDKAQDFKSKTLSETYMIDLKYIDVWYVCSRRLHHTLHTRTLAREDL